MQFDIINLHLYIHAFEISIYKLIARCIVFDKEIFDNVFRDGYIIPEYK